MSSDGSQEMVAQIMRIAAGLQGSVPQTAGQAWANASVVPFAQQIVPVDTGATRESIQGIAGPGGITISAGTDYASDLEYGTTLKAARPFISPAVQTTLPGLKQDLIAEINKLL